MDFLQGSTGALFWPAYLLWIRVDTAERASPADFFFFFFLCGLIQSEIGPDSDCYGLKYLFKQKKEKKKRKKKKKKRKRCDQNTLFGRQTLKETKPYSHLNYLSLSLSLSL